MDSRVESARVVDEAIGRVARLPRVPEYWGFSVEIAKNRAAVLAAAETPRTRKVALRTSMVLSPDRGGVFSVLSRLVRLGLGGSRGRAAVRLVDPRSRFRARLRALYPAPRPQWRDQPRRSLSTGAARIHEGLALRLGRSLRAPRDEVDGRDRRVLSPDRHRARAQESARRVEPSRRPRPRVSVRAME